MSDLEERLGNIEIDSYSEGSDSEGSDSEGSEDSDIGNPSIIQKNNLINSKQIISQNTDDKVKILTKYSDKIKTDEFLFKNKSLSKDKSDRATVENVLDPRTIGFIIKLIKKGIITKINGCLSTGKEANVYHAQDEKNGLEYAVKIYKTSILVFKDRERYVDGEFRFRNSRSQHNPRKMIKIWAEKEFRNLKRLYINGMNSPKPIDLKSHVLIMEFLSNGDGFPSPKLKDYLFKNIEEIKKFYYKMIYFIRFMYQKCRLVHADLSEYNSIVHNGELYIFDVSQSVEPEHPMSLDFLRMDIKNVNDFFMKKNIFIIPERLIFKFVIEDIKILGINNDSEDELIKFIENMPIKTTEEQVEDDEIFRSLHLLRSLNHLEERDFENFRNGKVDTMKSLVEDESRDDDDDDDAEEEDVDDSDSGSESDSSNGNENENEDEDDNQDIDEENQGKEWIERPIELKGKKYEDKDAKRERKLKAKEDAKEKRKTKMKKHVKKKLVNKGKSK